MSRLVFLDTECGGLDDSVHPLIEIAWAGEVGPIRSLVLPHDVRQCDPKALELNGYDARKLWDRHGWAPRYEVQHLWDVELLGATLVCSNPAYDERFLLAYARREDLQAWTRDGQKVDPWHHRKIDISAYAMPILGHDRPKGLATVIADLAERGFAIEAPDHSAAGDVHVMREAYQALQVLAEQLRHPIHHFVPTVTS